MVTSLNQRSAPREILYEVKQYICNRHVLTAADTPITKIGTIPVGAVITAISSKVVTAVTGGTPVLGIGSTTAGTAPVAATVGATGNVQNVMAEAAGSESLVPLAAFVMPLTVDTDFFIGTTGAATAGDVIVAIEFVKPLA